MNPGRVDKNQQQIVSALRKLGCSVAITSDVGVGFPDLVIGLNGVNFMVELKSEGGKLRESQVKFHKKWQGQIATCWNLEEVLKVIGYVPEVE